MIIYISYWMVEIYELFDCVLVLCDGMYVGMFECVLLLVEWFVVMMVGCDIFGFYKKEYVLYDFGYLLLLVCDVVDGVCVCGCSFDLYVGEVFGIVGFVGVGCIEFVWLIFGVELCVCGDVKLGECMFGVYLLCDVIDVGFVYLIEDCKC